MPVNTSITSDSSNAPIELPPITVTAPSPSGTGGSQPQSIIRPIDGSSGSILRYPSDLPKYYVQFDIMKHSRAGVMEFGQLTPQPGISTIAMALPSNLQDTSSVEYTDEKLGWLGAATGAVGGLTIDNFMRGGLGEAVRSLGGQL